ncbi:urea ABC transporter permease subunit UrtB [Stappia sp. F7233]|uniref:Urea ABC transporter permease subunit UrtB n=1 Tax=Stappia albiluteola TaxID=2758565 RepID=A0A839ADN1_9HYPH|nr:urea ABC transporter permease subunit UrtB [Stappia albiluteola]MBA5777064.1 urea ABC transporter permease subunit UrtB [Stappia albiluteola]
MRLFGKIAVALLVVFSALAPALAADDSLRDIVSGFADARNFSQTEKIVTQLGKTGDPAVVPLLEALGEGDLRVRKEDRAVFIAKGKGTVTLLDPLTREAVGSATERELTKIKVNNSLRRSIRDTVGGLALMAAAPEKRKAAASTLFANPDPAALDAIETAMAAEKDPAVAESMAAARAAAIVYSDRPDIEKSAAIEIIAGIGSRDALALLSSLEARSQGELKEQAAAAIARANRTLAFWEMGQNVWYGISLGSVLLLAAIGLAITFGVMGVINMAHGEMVMIGAYVTFVVQELIRTSAPGLFDWSLAIALPLAFLTAGAAGFAIERGVIRFLYGRPLETLLATWGISLILQQAVRTIFGPTNREVGTPSWMSGAFEIGQITITWNRLSIVIFALAVFFILLWALNRTSFGLQMRAVTQNRRMAASMGIRTPMVDAMTFALGSGIAGIAGVALSQIDNVSPNLGQGYIIDSFMVVVFGGVGNLWGTLVGALTLGIANKFLEPYAGAVLGKILVLVFIILFIQKRPRGLFALKGRAVEA